MDTILTFIIYGLVSGLLFSVLCWVLFSLSVSLLSVLFIIIAVVLLTTLLTVAPFVLVPLLLITPFLIVPICLYFLWQYYPHYIRWIRRTFLEIPRHLFQHYYLDPLYCLPRQSIRANTYYLLLGGIWAAILAVGLIIYQSLHGGFITQWNLSLYYAMRRVRAPAFDAFWVQISLLNSLMMSIFWGIISLYLILKKDSWRAIHWILLGLFIGAVTVGVKYGTAIPRPGGIFSIRDAFPSAHISIHMTLLGGLILLFELNKGSLFWSGWITYALYGIWLSLVAFSRMYLAAHWLTDIIGGILISLISLGLFAVSYYRRVPSPPIRGELLLISLGSLGSLWLMRYILEYEKILSFYMASF
jgi:membrane-associated phospholipid phosphatase